MPNRYLEIGTNPPLTILYEDHCLLAVNKTAGQLCQGHTNGLPEALDNQIKSYIRTRKGSATENIYLGSVQRLDRPVSGVIVFGLNSKFTSRLAEQFQKRQVEKFYDAVVTGVVKTDQGTLIDELSADPDDEGDPEGTTNQRCELSYRVTARGKDKTLLEVQLGTGRRNQIRRQFAKAGHPIIGDEKFGAGGAFPELGAAAPLFRPIALHAARLSILHPKTFLPLTITAPRPFYWQGLDL